MPDNNEVQFRCTIKKIFKNCPKSDGWYGMFAYVPKLRQDIALKGITNFNLSEGMQLDVIATPDTKGGYNWTSVSIVTQSQRGIVAYLSSLPGVSRQVALRVTDRYKSETIDKIENSPDEVKSECGLTDKQIESLKSGVKSVNEKNTLQKTFPELSPRQIDYVIRIYHDPIPEITANPYSLCDVPSIGFKQADTIALRLGIPAADPFRVNHGIVHILKNMDGHLYVNLSNDEEWRQLYIETEKLLNIRFTGSDELAQRLRYFAAATGSPIVLDRYNNETHLYLTSLYAAEEAIVSIIKHKLCQPANVNSNKTAYGILMYQRSTNRTLTKEQNKAVTMALNNSVSIITGGPGRGKTTIIDCIARNWTDGEIILLAPTGKAANKLNNATGGTFAKTTMTVDKLIVAQTYTCEKLTSFHKEKTCSYNKDGNLIIVDESSMLDVQKAAALLQCCSKCKFVFVGDIDQLPPIEPGNFLKDLIESGIVPVTVLTVPLRNSGAILENADKINNNDTNLSYNVTDMPFYPYPEEDKTMLDAVIEQYNEERQNCPDITQLALLCPVKKGWTGTVKLNITIQDIVCPENIQSASQPPAYDQRRNRCNFITKGYAIKSQMYGNSTDYTHFRIGDIVMNTKNQNNIITTVYRKNDFWNGNPDSTATGIFNGECGRIIAYIPQKSNLYPLGEEDETIVVQFFDGRIAQLNCSAGEFEPFQLGYALTVHKAQGCEYDTVIYISPKSMSYCVKNGFASKNIVYTAVTRAKKRIVIMGSKEGLNACISNNAPKRNSMLADKLKQ